MSKAERIQLRSFYRLVYVPSKDGFREIDLGIPVFGKTETLSREVINRLKAEGEIVEKLSPLLISEKYLRDKDYVETGRLFKAMLSTPGEPRVTKSKFISSIRDGVKQGIFGSGILRDGSVECLKFKENTEVLLSDYEVIIRKEICEKPKAEEGRVEEELEGYEEVEEEEKETGILVEDEDKEKPKPPVVIPKFKKVKLSVEVPRGKFSEFYTGVILPIEKSFGEAEIKIEIEAKNGEIPKSEYENKVKETLLQINAKFKEEELEE
jgi:hypothetical protein